MGTMIDLSKPVRARISEEEAFSRSHFDTEVIHLQNYDYFYSLMDRLNQLDASGQCSGNILLIWPPRGKILENPAEFGRLRGWASRHRYNLSMVIPGNSIYFSMAKEQSISVFHTVKEAESAIITEADELPELQNTADRIRHLALLKKDTEIIQETKSPLGIRFFLFFLTLFILCGTGYAIFPRARVDIVPYLTTNSIDMTIWTDERLDVPTMGGGIPTIEKKFELSLQTTVPASGQVQIAAGIAVGEVTIRNICDRVYASSAGVELSTNENIEQGIRFLTLEDATLEPGEERNIRIEAAEGGTDGNLPAGSIRFAAYPKSICWEVEQGIPTRGGSSGIYAAPDDADKALARQKILEQVADAVSNSLQNDPEGSDLMPLGDPVITSVRKEQFLPESGFASETLTLRQTLEVTLKTVRKSDMEAIIRGQSSRMNAQIEGLTGYEFLSGPTEENGLSRWSIRAEYLVYEPASNEEALQSILSGKSIAEAEKVLKSLEHVKKTNITLLPSWLKHMPLAAQNIRIIIHPAVEVENP